LYSLAGGNRYNLAATAILKKKKNAAARIAQWVQRLDGEN